MFIYMFVCMSFIISHNMYTISIKKYWVALLTSAKVTGGGVNGEISYYIVPIAIKFV